MPLEMLGPETGRGPFSSQDPVASAMQLATMIAQMRVPQSRLDADIQAHVDFIRDLADRLCPDFAVQLRFAVGAEVADTVYVSLIAPTGEYSLIDLWLSDAVGGGVTGTTAAAVTFNIGTVIETVVDKKHYRVLTSSIGVVGFTISYTSAKNWYIAATRQGRVWYSGQVHFA